LHLMLHCDSDLLHTPKVTGNDSLTSVTE
jgi:hypothetical protein